MPKSQMNLPPMPLPNRSQGDAARVIATPAEPVRTDDTQQQADAIAAGLFDAALTAAAISSKEAASLFAVSESLVNRMRSANYRERVSFAQMLRLPPAFHLALTRGLNSHFGFGKAALLDLLDAAGRLAVSA